MNHYKKIMFLKSIFFCIIFISIFIIITYIMRAENDSKQRFAGFYFETEKSIDVIYIGSSPVHPYWSAPLAWNKYGFLSYPLATSTQQPKAIMFLLKEALIKQKPQVVAFELRMFTRGQQEFDLADNLDVSIRNITDNMKLSLNRNAVIQALVPPTLNKTNYYFDIIKYHGLWKNIEKSDWQYWNFSKEDINKGHLIDDRVVDLSKKWQDYSYVKHEKPIPPEQEVVLRELLDYCKENNITALFTVNPYTDITEETQANFNYMQKIVEEEYGYSFLNFNLMYEELNIDFSKDFYNGGHMNASGAEKFTLYLGNYLAKNYNLQDKRTDPEYEAWNRAYEVWKVSADTAIKVINEKVEKGNYDE